MRDAKPGNDLCILPEAVLQPTKHQACRNRPDEKMPLICIKYWKTLNWEKFGIGILDLFWLILVRESMNFLIAKERDFWCLKKCLASSLLWSIKVATPRNAPIRTLPNTRFEVRIFRTHFDYKTCPFILNKYEGLRLFIVWSSPIIIEFLHLVLEYQKDSIVPKVRMIKKFKLSQPKWIVIVV